MGQIKVTTCEIEGLKVIEPRVFGDERGYFFESYNYNDFKEAGIPQVFVQDNQSASKRGVLRGLHFQKNFPQDKLVRVIRGEVLRHTVSGLELFFQRIIRNSSLFQRILPTDFLFYRIMLNLHISVPIFIILMMRAVCFTMTLISVWRGLLKKVLN